jgi:hypothetical protein
MNGIVRHLGGTAFRGIAVAIACTATIVGCGLPLEADYPESTGSKGTPRYSSEGPAQAVFGTSGVNILDAFGPGKKSGLGGAGGGGIGVNSFLWRATLDTVLFMPLNSADPFGGVIITDWYTPPEAPSERFKMNIYILGRQLRADGLRVAVFRQAQSSNGNWINASVKSETSISLENQILTRARQLRVAAKTTN